MWVGPGVTVNMVSSYGLQLPSKPLTNSVGGKRLKIFGLRSKMSLRACPQCRVVREWTADSIYFRFDDKRRWIEGFCQHHDWGYDVENLISDNEVERVKSILCLSGEGAAYDMFDHYWKSGRYRDSVKTAE